MTFEELPPTSDEEGEALAFLDKGRRLRGLSPDQFRRIENRLALPNRPIRARPWLPVLAAATLALLAGAALARVTDVSRLPFIDRLFSSHAPGLVLPKAPRANRHPGARPSGGQDPSDSIPASTPPAKNQPAEEHVLGARLHVAPERAPRVERPEKPHAPPPPSDLSPSATLPAARPGVEVGRSLSLAFPPGPGPAAEARDRAPVRGEISPPRAAEWAAPGTMRTPTGPVVTPSNPVANMQGPAEDPISAESRSFSAALAEWHRDHDAEAALAALDRHERRFPYGQIRLEAKLLRAEILLQKAREPEALRLLDSVSLSGLPRGRELQTVRGELRVKYGRCREGRSDLEHVLTKDKADSLGLRAARALSLCP